MASDSEDNYDYLSELKTEDGLRPKGGHRPKGDHLPKDGHRTETHEVITLDSDSDEEAAPEDDSDEILILEGTEDNRDVNKICNDFHEANSSRIKEDNSNATNDEERNSQEVRTSIAMDALPRSSSQESNDSHPTAGPDLNNVANNESKSVIKTQLSEQTLDQHLDIKPSLTNVKQEIKVEVKTETLIKSEVKSEVKTENNENINAINNDKDFCGPDSNESSERSGSPIKQNVDESKESESTEKTEKLDHDVDHYLLDAIELVRSQHQKPTFDRILVTYKKLRPKIKATPIFILRLHIDESIKKGIIKAIESKHGNGTSYFPVKDPKSRSTCSNAQSCVRESTSFDSSQAFENHQTSNANSVRENSKSNESLDDHFIDFSDIEVRSDREVDSDSELSPQMFPSLPSHMNNDSMSFNSVPIKSYNHSRNREVIRRHTTVPSSCDPSQIEDMLSKADHQDWLLEELPRYTPFIGQIGDRVVYLRDAHNIYLKWELKELQDLYKESNCNVEQIDSAIGADKYVVKAIVSKVKFYQNNYIRFSIIELKNTEDSHTFHFNVLYRPNRGICDFLVLEKFFNDSQLHEWKIGSEFRSLWKKSWWTGKVIGKEVFNKDFPLSPFKCYKIQWNTGETGCLSAWDMFEIDPNRLPKRKENGIVVNREDLLDINYKPNLNEWPEVENLDFQKWRYYELKRIYNAIKFIETNVHNSVFKLLEVPPNKEISYPIDLKLIKKRLKNLFYRRKDAVITEFEMLKANAKLYIKPRDLKFGEDLVSLLLTIAKDTQIVNHEQLKDLLNKHQNLIEGLPVQPVKSSSRDNESRKRSSTSASSSKKKHKSNKNNSSQLIASSSAETSTCRRSSAESSSPEVETTENEQWKADLRKFIEEILKKPESEPYRKPVDPELFPYYKTVIKNPIALSDIQANLNTNFYRNPKEVRVDFRLMYTNAKVFTKDPKSVMRKNNKMLSNWSEDKLREIIVDWQRVYSYEQRKKNSNGVNPREPISRNQLWGFGAQQYY